MRAVVKSSFVFAIASSQHRLPGLSARRPKALRKVLRKGLSLDCRDWHVLQTC